jgi:hypothetical protein
MVPKEPVYDICVSINVVEDFDNFEAGNAQIGEMLILGVNKINRFPGGSLCTGQFIQRSDLTGKYLIQLG